MRDLIEKGILPDGKEEETIEEIIKEENLINYTKIIEAGSQKGDNYLGGIYRIIINGIDSKINKPKELSLILKCSPRSGAFRSIFPHNSVFKRECFMYNTYLPELYKIQKENHIENGFQKVAKLYKCSTEELDEFIIFEDMKHAGFVMLNRQECLDVSHCKFVLKQLAYLHGLGFVLKQQKPELFKKLTTNQINVWNEMLNGPMYAQFAGHMNGMAQKASVSLEDEPELFQKFEQYRSKLTETVEWLMKPENIDTEYSVLIHNDCWNNNFLFKHEDENNPKAPTDICLLDWQISELHSPVKDLSYFLYNCTSTELRDEHFTDLLDYYYEELTDVLNKCNCSVDVSYPRAVFERHLKTYFIHGATFALMTIPLFTSDTEDIPDHYSQNGDSKEFDINLFNFKSKNDAIYKLRIGGILKHAIVNKFI